MTKKTAPRIRARVTLDRITVIADVINPGGWFGKFKVLQLAIANALNPFFVVEANCDQDAIDAWADSDTYSHFIDDDEAQAVLDGWQTSHPGEDYPESTTAGNDGHCVNLDNVAFCRNVRKVEYFLDLDPSDHDFVNGVQGAIEQWHKENDDEV